MAEHRTIRMANFMAGILRLLWCVSRHMRRIVFIDVELDDLWYSPMVINGLKMQKSYLRKN